MPTGKPFGSSVASTELKRLPAVSALTSVQTPVAVTPVNLLDKSMIVKPLPLRQTGGVATAVPAETNGLMSNTTAEGAPTQPDKVGTTVMIDRCKVATAAAVNGAIVPVLLAANPVAVLLFVQLNVAPTGVLVNAIADTASVEQ